jgi:deoxyribodipyrimidine photo-lyase
MTPRKGIVWFRTNLRIDDNAVIARAMQECEHLTLVYCFDPAHFTSTPLGFPKTGPHRARFLIESVANLRDNLRAVGSDLVVRFGSPEDELSRISQELEVKTVFAKCEVTDEEVHTEQRVSTALDGRLQLVWDDTLFHIDDLPFSIPDLPEIFTDFRKTCEAEVSIRDATNVDPPGGSPGVEPGDLPTLQQLGVDEADVDERCAMQFDGGETAARNRLEEYFWKRDRLHRYKDTRDGLIGEDYSSKFSPWLAQGCLSPRQIFEEIKRYEASRVRNRSTYWLGFELMWRDYFRFIALKHGAALFQAGGIRNLQRSWRHDHDPFERWRTGNTGEPFIDANMRELAGTGFMSNRGRQNVASFLAHELGIDWRWGAEWFESQLIDYDVCSNWGNWNYVAGVGNDPREGRRFNPQLQARRYDPGGEFVRLWLS